MNKHLLPAAPEALSRTGLMREVSPFALTKWNPHLRAAVESEAHATISILEPIVRDPFTGEGVSAKSIGSALHAIGGQEVTLYLNSPGGDFFEGLAIYNQLREYPGHVTVKILGIAASAASCIAMAGDEIQMARTAFLMIHNARVGVAGNRLHLRQATDVLDAFDKTMAEIYAARTGQATPTLRAMMDAETWIAATDAISQGFADALFDADVDTQDLREEKQAPHPDSSIYQAHWQRALTHLALAPLLTQRK